MNQFDLIRVSNVNFKYLHIYVIPVQNENYYEEKFTISVYVNLSL